MPDVAAIVVTLAILAAGVAGIQAWRVRVSRYRKFGMPIWQEIAVTAAWALIVTTTSALYVVNNQDEDPEVWRMPGVPLLVGISVVVGLAIAGPFMRARLRREQEDWLIRLMWAGVLLIGVSGVMAVVLHP